VDEVERELVELFDADLVDEELTAEAAVVELMDELGILGSIRSQMLGDLGRARAVLVHAKSSSGIRNRAAFAIANWRARFDPRGRAEGAQLRLVEEAPTLDALELAWSLDSPIAREVVRMMTVAIERTGGARALLERAGMTPLEPQTRLKLEP
jgi:hypothetical protein